MKRIYLVTPGIEGNCNIQFEDCLQQIHKILSEAPFITVLKCNVFLETGHLDEFIDYRHMLTNILNSSVFLNNIPVSFVPQPPLDSTVCIEVFAADADALIRNMGNKRLGDINYMRIDYEDRTEIISGGISLDIHDADFISQAEYCLEKAGELLQNEGFTYSDIVRQWNYLGNICECVHRENCTNQNYQHFNDLRTKFFNTAEWCNGYPSSTGIGISINRCILDFIAVKPKQGIKIIPLRNPRQVDAHKYSPEVLKGEAVSGFERATTPKFERGKIILGEACAEIFVSGTAAILGQDSVNNDNAETQAKITIGNILELVSKENLSNHGVDMTGKKTVFRCLRVYLKNKEEYLLVKNICDEYFGDIPITFVQAEVCRFELLVEIEAYLILQNEY